ncbi:hypothetical protein ACLB2K_056985 [Fragaria x ananassa]
MNRIGADEVGQILRLVTDPSDRKSASQVCKGWWVMEGLSRSTLRVLNIDHLPRLLASCPKLEAFILDHISLAEAGSFARLIGGPNSDELEKKVRARMEVGDQGLCAVANGCPKLSKIVINNNYAGVLGIIAMITSAAHNLTHLELEICSLLTDQALEAIGSSSCRLSFLSFRFSSKITDAGLRFLANGSCSKTIKQLKLCR